MINTISRLGFGQVYHYTQPVELNQTYVQNLLHTSEVFCGITRTALPAEDPNALRNGQWMVVPRVEPEQPNVAEFYGLTPPDTVTFIARYRHQLSELSAHSGINLTERTDHMDQENSHATLGWFLGFRKSPELQGAVNTALTETINASKTVVQTIDSVG